MRLTTKGRYAVTAMLDLACHQEQPIRLSDIAARQHIPLTYLEQICAQLRAKGLLKSVRGPGGGYLLNLEASQINLYDIITAVNEPLDSTQCAGEGDCSDGDMCLTHHLWEAFNTQLHGFLKSLSLADLSSSPNVQQVAQRQMGDFSTQKLGITQKLVLGEKHAR